MSTKDGWIGVEPDRRADNHTEHLWMAHLICIFPIRRCFWKWFCHLGLGVASTNRIFIAPWLTPDHRLVPNIFNIEYRQSESWEIAADITGMFVRRNVPYLVFVWFDSLCPINNLSVKQGRIFLGLTSTKLGSMCLAQGPQCSDAGEPYLVQPHV